MTILKKVIKILGKIFLYYIGICIVVQLMCMSENIGVSKGNTYIEGVEGSRWNYSKFPNSKFKETKLFKVEFKTYEAPKIKWVEVEKNRIENFN